MPYSVTLAFTKNPEINSDSRETVDHYRSTIAKQVTPGQIVAYLSPLTDAEPEPQSTESFIIEDHADIIDPTIELAEIDGKTVIISRITGFPVIKNKKIVIKQNLIIDGDVNFHTGNIDCPGDLLINGSIMAGFKVRAENLTVSGSIENAKVECSGNLVCGGGIVACHDYPLQCGANLWCKYLENSHIEARKNIFINGSSLHSFLKAGKNIILCASESVLVGGKSEAGNSLYSGTLGAKWATPTEIILGCDPFLAKALEVDSKLREELSSELDDLKTRIDQINIFLQHEEANTTRHDAKRLQEERELLESKLSYVMQKHRAASHKVKDLANRIAAFKQTNDDCFLYVAKQLFSGIRLLIKDAETRTEEESSATGVRMYEQAGEIIKKF